MPPPATVPDFLDLVRRSGIVPPDKLDPRLAVWEQQGLPAQQDKVANLLVRDGLLTHFQAKQLLQGRWRRFMIGTKYKLLELLGAGGMGAVYLCEHVFMRRLVALKVLPVDKLAEPSMLERFYREARASAALDHPNIVRAYDIDQFEKLHFLVMEYVEGSSLQEIVGKFGPMSVERACHYIAQAAFGLQHASEAGMVHRDIKPGNLLVDRTGTLKLLDMGLARFFGNKNDSVTEKYDDRSVLGTADYLAPEQALNQQLDIRADIYSLGGTLYFMLTGSLMFPDGTIAQKLIWHQKRDPAPISEFRSDVPEELEAIIFKMLAKRPENRYQSPAQVIEALTPWISEPIEPPPVSEMPQLCPAVLNVVRQSDEAVVPSASGMPVAAPAPATTAPPAHASNPATPALPLSAMPAALRTRVAGMASNRSSAGSGVGTTTATLSPPVNSRAKNQDSGSNPPQMTNSNQSIAQSPLIMPIILGLIAAIVGVGIYYFVFAPGNPTPPIRITSINPEGKTPVVTPPVNPMEVDESNLTIQGTLTKVEDLKALVGQKITLEFRVMSTGGNTNVFLNTSSAISSNRPNFAVKIRPELLEDFKAQGINPLTDYRGKRVRIEGVIEDAPKEKSFQITPIDTQELKVIESE